MQEANIFHSKFLVGGVLNISVFNLIFLLESSKKNSIIDISNEERNGQIALLGGVNSKSVLRKFKHEEYDRYSMDPPFDFKHVKLSLFHN